MQKTIASILLAFTLLLSFSVNANNTLNIVGDNNKIEKINIGDKYLTIENFNGSLTVSISEGKIT